MDSGRHPLPTVFKGEGITPEAILVVSDGRRGQAGSLACGRESACFADGQLPVLTHPESVSALCCYVAGWASELSICKLTESKTSPVFSSPEWLSEGGS